MTLTQLKYFCTVCKYNNISKAAAELYVSQPSVSIAIRELEEEFQEKLFIRNNNKLLLTEAGQMLREMAEDLLAQSDMIVSRMSDIGKKNQILRIGIFSDLYKWALPYTTDIIDGLREKYVNLETELSEVSPFELPEIVKNHTVDVLFCNGEDNKKVYGFGTKVICRTHMMVCMNENHPLAREKVITKEMFRGQELIGNYYNREKHEQWVKNFFKECDFTPRTKHFFLQLNSVYETLRITNDLTIMRPAVNGVSVEGIAVRPIETDHVMEIHLIYDNRYILSNVVADFIELAKKTVVDEGI